MKKSFLALLALLASCTYNQQKHLDILLSPRYQNYSPAEDAWIVEQSLPFPSDDFSLSLTQLDASFFFLKGDQIPPGERFIFASVDPMNGKIEVSFEFEWTEDGKVQVFEKNKIRIEDEIPFIASAGLIAAKPVLYTVVSKKSYTSATAEFIPYPIESQDENGKVSLVATHPLLTRFELRAEEFQPGETVKLIHQSGDQIEEIEVRVPQDGSFTLPLNPTVLGRMGGDASLTVERSGSAFSIDYPWGARLEKRTFESRVQFPILFVVNRTIEEIDPTSVESEFAALMHK
ncbi:MAG: hypothetical protein A3E80_06745 [Chlamydiae bacterium RIFCSPHIGHO2_12_FULL_49_9]|nr:MAG: hypothetical protein A3E80_06745 [Chlamydiae bacterium RIFCSPHIGHO2_12_FULL_49_9]